MKDILVKKLHISRDFPMNRVQRITYGPDFRGHKPIQVCIVHYRDKEEILRKARLLKGSNIYISEDFSRKGIYLNVFSYCHKYKQNIPKDLVRTNTVWL